MPDASERSIPATPRRREAARQQGSMPMAAILAWVATVAAALLLLPHWLRTALPAAAELMRQSLAAAIRDPSDLSIEAISPAAILPVSLVLPTAALVLVAGSVGLAVRFFLDGSAWRLGRAAPALDRINPLAGIARIFSLQTLWSIVGNACGLAALVAVAAWSATPLFSLIASADPAPESGPWMAAVGRMLLPVVATAGGLAACQWGLARIRFEKRIRMTPDEFKDESRGMQADPKIRLLQRKSG